MAPAVPLGAEEWSRHGGETKTLYHPGGRFTIYYITPERDQRFRSWKQCQNWIESQIPKNLAKRCNSENATASLEQPEKKQKTASEKKLKASPEKKRVTSPEKKRMASPEKKRMTSPERKRMTSPEKTRMTSPERNRMTSPEKKQKTAPENKQKVSPEKKRKNAPEEKQKTSTAKQPKNSTEKQPKTSIEKQPKTPTGKQPKTPTEKQPKISTEKQSKISFENQPKISSSKKQKKSSGKPLAERATDAAEPYPHPAGEPVDQQKKKGKRPSKKDSASGSGSGSGPSPSSGSRKRPSTKKSDDPGVFPRDFLHDISEDVFDREGAAFAAGYVPPLALNFGFDNGGGTFGSDADLGNGYAYATADHSTPSSDFFKESAFSVSPLACRSQDDFAEPSLPSNLFGGNSAHPPNPSSRSNGQRSTPPPDCNGCDKEGSDWDPDSEVPKKQSNVAAGKGDSVPRSRPKRAVARKNLKEKDIDLCEQDAYVARKLILSAETEEEAVTQSNCDVDPPDCIRRDLLDFCIVDSEGRPALLEGYKEQPLFVTGIMYPRGDIGELYKVCDGYRCENIGPITDWFLMGYEKGEPIIGVTTDVADYYLEKASRLYTKFTSAFLKKCRLCLVVYDSFATEGPDVSMERIFAKLFDSFCKEGKDGRNYNRRYFEGHRMFVVEQLLKLEFFIPKTVAHVGAGSDKRKEERVLFSDTRVWRKLAADYNGSNGSAQVFASGSSSGPGVIMSQDERMAWQLQEEDDDRARMRQSRKTPASKGKYYVKINETEIAGDYPLPAYYKNEDDETDEFLLSNDDDDIVHDPKDLPTRMLHDWSLYNTDSRFVSLELIPMLEAETDTETFGSGLVTEEDSWDFNADGAQTSRGAGETASLVTPTDQGIRVSLSSIKEWKIELGYDGDFISIRTERAWYRLGKPSRHYEDWFKPVVKTARLAREIVTMLTEEHRINRLSLKDVVRRLSLKPKGEDTYISGKILEVERYIVVHGPIIWQIFAEYPIEMVRRCSFINGLSLMMEQVSHTKLGWSKKTLNVSGRRSNLNPNARAAPDHTKRKPMRATTTRLVDSIWKGYYAGDEDVVKEAGVDKEVEVIEEEVVVESDESDEEVEIRPTQRETPRKKRYSKGSSPDVHLEQVLHCKTSNNERVFQKVTFRRVQYTCGTAVQVQLDDDAPGIVMLLIEYIYETRSDGAKIHGRVLQKGVDTILGNAANELEVFLTDACEDVEVEKIRASVEVHMRIRNWGHEYRTENAEKDKAEKAAAEERQKHGLPQEYFCRSWYSPERGAFLSLPKGSLSLGNGSCKACEMRRETGERVDVKLLGDKSGFRFEGVTYTAGDFIYVDPSAFGGDRSVETSLHKAGRNKGLQAYSICHLLNICSPKNGTRGPLLMKVRRFYRPEDIDRLKAYRSDIHEIYYSEETSLVDMPSARGKCVVRRHVTFKKNTADDVLFCNTIYDPKSGALSELPSHVKLSPEGAVAAHGNLEAEEVAAREKGKGKSREYETAAESVAAQGALSTLDIFAGCGGLAEGLHQSGVANTKWAIEYDHAASEAFKLNHPTTNVFCDNCNVVLRAIMEEGGDLSDCVSTPEADALCAKLDSVMKLKLPRPGEVDFISGGPPCQGFSGMNRFNERAWSKVQCEMILSFLSYVEYLRPRFFLLENVRNFVSFNKGQTFRLTLRTLLEMGYQVRFGVLQAGNYGVAQSRKRAFVWAVAPDESLPEWPQPRHVFAGSQLGIALPGGVQYSAIKYGGRGAPFRPITVRDTIGDLPPAKNGASQDDLPYERKPDSWFQQVIRGESMHLLDHISKEMNELNMIRCQRIPKEPGADWRTLPDEKIMLSTGVTVDLVPWCLPNTAARHNQWKGLFGRLDWDGNFPTSVTDPQPMGKVGMCFHPEQDRIVTVRECARSQGFPDHFKFFGHVSAKHRQIGNAVPPPLARALGYMLKEVVRRRDIPS